MSNDIVAYSDRSTCVSHQSCPRKRWYNHEHPTEALEQGTKAHQAQDEIHIKTPGVVTASLNMDLTLGSVFHTGLYHLYNGCSLDEAVGRALYGDTQGWEGYWPLVKKSEFALIETEAAEYVYYEQASLGEALIRGYFYAGLPKLLEEYNILETEYDEQAYFTDRTVPGFGLRWGIRTDGLLQDKTTGDLVVLSLKTKKEWRKGDENKCKRDMQGYTELHAVEQRIQRWHGILEGNREAVTHEPREHAAKATGVPVWYIKRFLEGHEPFVFGVKMEFALKGWRGESPKGSGQYKFNNPLIRPWRKANEFSDDEYAVKYEFQDENGGGHRLGKGWNQINIWDQGQMGVKDWVEYCVNNRIQNFAPGFTLQDRFVFPSLMMRNPVDMDRKIRQIVTQEYQVHVGREAALQALREGNIPEFNDALDIYFHQQQDFPHDCSYCSYEAICFGAGDEYRINPLAHPKYVRRTPNHVTEGLIQID